MLDDLRRGADGGSFEDFEEVEDDFSDFDFEGSVIEESAGPKRGFMGMSAAERMLISLFLFLNVTIIGMAILVASGRIRFG